MIRSVMMMSLLGGRLVFEPGLGVVPLGAVPGLVGVPVLDVEGTDLAGVAELEVEGTVEPVGAAVSLPVAEGSTDMGRRKTGRNQLREGSTV